MNGKPWLLIYCALFLTLGAQAQNNQVSWWTIDMGFGTSRESNTMLSSLVGQECIGFAREGNTILTVGFLADPSLWQTVVSVSEHGPIPGAYALHRTIPIPLTRARPSSTSCREHRK